MKFAVRSDQMYCRWSSCMACEERLRARLHLATDTARRSEYRSRSGNFPIHSRPGLRPSTYLGLYTAGGSALDTENLKNPNPAVRGLRVDTGLVRTRSHHCSLQQGTMFPL